MLHSSLISYNITGFFPEDKIGVGRMRKPQIILRPHLYLEINALDILYFLISIFNIACS